MTCRIRHRWRGWHFSLCDECHGVDDAVVWRMCRRCGAHEERESAEPWDLRAADWLLRRNARRP